jgi:hypothetical protein
VDNQSHCERLSRNRIADRPVRLARQTKLGSQSQISVVPGLFRFWLLLFPIDTPYTASPDAIIQGGFVKRPFSLAVVHFEVARASCPCAIMAKMAMPPQTEPLPSV